MSILSFWKVNLTSIFKNELNIFRVNNFYQDLDLIEDIVSNDEDDYLNDQVQAQAQEHYLILQKIKLFYMFPVIIKVKIAFK